MKNKTLMCLGVVLVLGLIGCGAKEKKSKDGYQKISPEEAKEMIDQGNVTVVDVRTPEEYEEGHIEGALLIPNEEIDDTAPDELPDKDAVLLVYCRSGRRSKIASEALVKIGYSRVYDFGGIIDWEYETVTGMN